MKRKIIVLMAFAVIFFAHTAWAGGAHGGAGNTLLWLAIILCIGMFGRLAEKFKQSSVLGQLVAGVIIGNLHLVGIDIFLPIRTDPNLPFLAELGVAILLFQVGLESNVEKMRKFGGKALLVAIVGVIAPFGLMILFGPLLLPDASVYSLLFLSSALTATSVAITAKVFKDFNMSQSKEAQIILGAAVDDDILGLIILAVVSAIITTGTVSGWAVAWIIIKALLFLVGSLFIGRAVAPLIGKFFSKIHNGVGTKLTLALIVAFVFGATAEAVGLSIIVGTFAAGLVLDPVDFDFFHKSETAWQLQKHALHINDHEIRTQVIEKAEHHNKKHVEDLIKPIEYLLVPVFFVMTGIHVDLSTFFNPSLIGTALIVTLIAFVGKWVAGFAAGKGVHRSLIGFGMVPRGEVGLIFASMGKALGVFNDDLYSIVVIMIILTTIGTPPILAHLLKKQ